MLSWAKLIVRCSWTNLSYESNKISTCQMVLLTNPDTKLATDHGMRQKRSQERQYIFDTVSEIQIQREAIPIRHGERSTNINTRRGNLSLTWWERQSESVQVQIHKSEALKMGTGKHCWYSSFWNSQFFDCEEAPVEKSLRNNFSQRGSHYAAAVLTWLDKYKHKYKFKQNWQIPKHTCGSHRFSCSVSFLFAFCIKVWFCRMLVYRLHQLASSDKTAFRRFWRHTIKTGETNHQQQKRERNLPPQTNKKESGKLGLQISSRQCLKCCRGAANNLREVNFVAVSSKWLGFDTFIEIYWNDSNKQLSKCSSALST